MASDGPKHQPKLREDQLHMIVDFLVEVFVWLIYGLGALIFWLLKGCKTKLIDEIENYKIRNAIASSTIFVLIVVIVVKVNN